jgi:putative endonuclease
MESGKAGEDLAAGYLVENRYRIIERNFKCALGEIDIIARDGPAIVFIEVKSRKSARYGRPEEAVDRRKQAKLSRIALAYLKSRSGLDTRARFDVVSVYLRPGGPEIRLFKNAFDLVL